ncbi:virulence factor TspB C-terminal domain-related protein [Acinetobacter sp. BSP-53]|uniref:virulence factor TspB C-terminal domain-related protein n=1 Tax=Acinetobacter sp. BSP-53 TaxID=3344662 RepID=UPI00376FAC3D
MGRITSFSKQVIVFFLVTALIIRPTFAANVGGWTLGGAVAQGASTVYDATKNVVINGKKYIKESSVKITPTASQVAKVLARGAAGYALSVAVEQLLGAVDWVLDPENNRVIYYPPQEPTGLWAIDGVNYIYTSGTAAAQAKCSEKGQTYRGYDHSRKYALCTRPNGTNDQWSLSYQATKPSEREEKYLPLPTVAQQVISNAESGDSSAQAATTAAAADIVAEAEKDDAKARPIASQAEANATTKPADAAEAEKANEAQGEAKPNEANPEATDLSITFPIFCDWAPTICEAAQTVISFPQTLTNWWETGKTKAEEWATSISEAWAKVKEEYYDQPEENTDTELEILDLEQDIEVDTDISFGGSCPAPLSSDINFMGLNKTIEFSFDPVCQIAEFIKPVVISISAFSAALIVAGIRTEDD